MIDFTTLPVYRSRQQILDVLENSQVIIVESPTGSGKTTQIPLILNEAGYSQTGIIGITQPRRIAAVSVCEFIKKQIDDRENFCGYTMRFHDTTDSSTRIKIMTDGILLQEVKDDPVLSRYSVIMVDEAHERSLNIDFILGLLKEIIPQRPDLKVIISSATINTKSFSDFFDGAPVVSIDGRMYPVDVQYYPVHEGFSGVDVTYDRICEFVYRAHLDPDGGDVLVFLPGEAEINQCLDALRHYSFIELPSYQIYPLYGKLSKEEQERVFTPTGKGKTKVVVATNIAETSLTIDGIRTVIDTGTVKINYYNQENFTSSLITTAISKASADQRKGRAGRTESGVCYRLYSEASYDSRKDFTEEQILHSDLAEVVLRMSELGIYNPETFPFITAPKKEALASAVKTLKYIGATDDNNHLSNIGEMMIKFPLVPRLSRVIVESIMAKPLVIDSVLTAVSFLSTKGPFVTPEDKVEEARERHHMLIDNKNGDFAAYLTIYRKYISIPSDEDKKKFCDNNFLDKQTMDEIVHIKGQLREIVSNMGIPVSEQTSVDMQEYLICLASGLRQYICRKEEDLRCDYYGMVTDRSYYTSIGADRIYIHPGSSWFTYKPKYILAGELVETSKLFARTVSPLEGKWINEIDPSLLSTIGRNKRERLEVYAKSLSGTMLGWEYKATRKRLWLPEEPITAKQREEEAAVKEAIRTGEYKGKKVYNFRELGSIEEQDDTEVYATIDGHISREPFPANIICHEYFFVRRHSRLAKKNNFSLTQNITVKPGSCASIKEKLESLLMPYVSKREEDGCDGYFDYIYLAYKEAPGGAEYQIIYTSDVKEAARESYYSMKKMLSELPRGKKSYDKLRSCLEKQIALFKERCGYGTGEEEK